MKERRFIRVIGSFIGKNLYVYKIFYEIFFLFWFVDKKKSFLVDFKNG